MSFLINPYSYGGGYPSNAVTFDGTNDYLTGAASSPYFADSKLFSASFWFRATNTAKICLPIYCAAGSALFYLEVNSGGFQISGSNSGGTTLIGATASTGSSLYDGNWHHFAISFDLSDSSNRTVKIDNATPSSVTWSAFVNAAINFQCARTNMIVCENTAFTGSVNRYAGDLAEVYIAPGKNLRFDQTSNLRKFISANGKPVQRAVNGGFNGADIPDIWLSGETATWHQNKGNAGGFTVNGALTTSANLPVGL